MRSTPQLDVSESSHRHEHKASIPPVEDHGSRHRHKVAKIEPKQNRVNAIFYTTQSALFPLPGARAKPRP